MDRWAIINLPDSVFPPANLTFYDAATSLDGVVSHGTNTTTGYTSYVLCVPPNSAGRRIVAAGDRDDFIRILGFEQGTGLTQAVADTLYAPIGLGVSSTSITSSDGSITVTQTTQGVDLAGAMGGGTGTQFASQQALENFIQDKTAFRMDIGAGTGNSNLTLGTTASTALAGNTPTIQDLADTAVNNMYISEIDIVNGVTSITRATLPSGGGNQPHNIVANERLTGTGEQEFVSGNTQWTIGCAVNSGFSCQIIDVTVPGGVTTTPGNISSSNPVSSFTLTSTSTSPVSIPITVRVQSTNTTDNTVEHRDVTATLHSFNGWFTNSFTASQSGVTTTGYTDRGRFDGDETINFTPTAAGTDEFFEIVLPTRTNGYRFRLGGFDFTADETEAGTVSGVNYTRYEFVLRRSVIIEITSI